MRYPLASLLLFLSLIPRLALSQPATARREPLQSSIETIAAAVNGNVGVAIMRLETGGIISLHGNDRFPMQSVYKFPIAMAVLHQIDQGKRSLDTKIHVDGRDYAPAGMHSPLRDTYSPGPADITISELLRYSVSESDGTACDVLLRILGGPKKVEAYIHGLGIREIAIATTEKEMAAGPMVQYRNWCHPAAMARLLNAFFMGKGLSPASHALLSSLMINTTTGLKRIRGRLPAGTVVEHKTGTARTSGGMTRATNDVGIITLPNGDHIAVAVFISDSRSDEGTRESTIAGIARAAWNYAVGGGRWEPR
ncbi:MAG: class beta-lactamase [Chlorobi bacterium]|nr:class beta-lactamase [Chlorobiota bacterium]